MLRRTTDTTTAHRLCAPRAQPACPTGRDRPRLYAARVNQDRYGSDVLRRRPVDPPPSGAHEPPAAGGGGPRRRGGHHRLGGCGGPGREVRRRAHRGPRGPPRTDAHVPARPGLLGRRRAGRADRARSARRRPPRPTRTASGSVARARRPGARRPRQPDLGRGQARRRARREGLGRRPAARGRRRRAAGRRRQPARTRSATSPRARPARRRARRPPRGRQPRRAGSPPTPSGRPRPARSWCSGHPYVDVWQAVRPERIGLSAWPTIERGTEWKDGILRELGWPARRPGRRGARLEADPALRAQLRRPRAQPARPGRGAHRLRHRMTVPGHRRGWPGTVHAASGPAAIGSADSRGTGTRVASSTTGTATSRPTKHTSAPAKHGGEHQQVEQDRRREVGDDER